MGDTAFSTPAPALEEALAALRASAAAWAATPFERRAALARECAQLSVGVAEAMAADAVAYKGTYEVGDGEEVCVWAATPAVLNDLAHSLDALGAKRARCPTAVRWRAAAGGAQQAVARVFPDPLFEHLLFSGYEGELWLQPGAVRAPCACARSPACTHPCAPSPSPGAVVRRRGCAGRRRRGVPGAGRGQPGGGGGG